MSSSAAPTGTSARQPGIVLGLGQRQADGQQRHAEQGRAVRLCRRQARSGFPMGCAGQQRAGQQFPGTAQRRVESGGAMMDDAGRIQREGQQRQARRDRHQVGAPAPGQQQYGRPDDVELFLDPQRPQVQQGLGTGGGVEVAHLRPVKQIGGEACPAGHVLAQLPVLVGEQRKPAEGQAGEHHGQQRREDAPDAPRIEAGHAEPALLQFAQQDARDQVAGNDEEDVDADEAAGQERREGVEQDHRQHGDGAQAVDVRAVGKVGGRRARGGCRGWRSSRCSDSQDELRKLYIYQ
jgi:hypothetical protein